MREIVLYFLKLGAVGFGGPIALVARMRSDLVDNRLALTEAEYQEALSFSQLAPGPLAAQVASYIGWLRGGWQGALLAGLAFVASSLLMVIVLAWGYVTYGGLAWLEHAFYGVGAGVIAIIARGSFQLTRKTVGTERALWLVFVVNALFTALLAAESASLIILSGVAYLISRRPLLQRRWALSLAPTALVIPALFHTDNILVHLTLFFAKASLFVFGSGLAIIPFLHSGVVEGNQWLTERQFMDAIAVSMITPGPVVITVSFIGYVVAGLPGAIAAAAGIFLPIWFSVAAFAPFYRRLQRLTQIHLFVRGLTAAVVGALAGAVVVIGMRTVTDPLTAVIALAALLLLSSKRFRIPEPAIVLLAALVGILANGYSLS